MPIYVYEVILEDEDEPGQLFEVVQGIHDPPLTEHPTTGQPVRRVIQAPHIGGRWGSGKAILSDRNIAAHGFTRFEKTADGRWEKTAGAGPEQIHYNRGS